MSIRIVDEFEFVQVNEHHGQRSVMSFCLFHAMFQAVIEQYAIRQARQNVMEGGVACIVMLFYRCRKQVINHVALPDFTLQRPTCGRQRPGCFAQLLRDYLALCESLLERGRLAPMREFLLDSCVDQHKLPGAFVHVLHHVLDVAP
jgi:hypothetical protein